MLLAGLRIKDAVCEAGTESTYTFIKNKFLFSYWNIKQNWTTDKCTDQCDSKEGHGLALFGYGICKPRTKRRDAEKGISLLHKKKRRLGNPACKVPAPYYIVI